VLALALSLLSYSLSITLRPATTSLSKVPRESYGDVARW